MQWKPEYALGIDEIDDQHKSVIAKLDEVSRIVAASHNWATADHALFDLTQAARRNFEFEEGLMRLLAIPSAEEHRKLHEQFYSRITEIQTKSIRGVVVAALLQSLHEWYVDHIRVADRRDYTLIVSSIVRAVKAKQKS